MQQIPEVETFKAHIQALYTKYLVMFSNEMERLARLKQCLDLHLDIHLRSTMQGHITASAIILSEDKAQVFLIHHKALNKWIFPGGHYDLEDLTPWQCAKRETMEETGMEQLILDHWHQRNGNIPLDIDIHPIPANPAKNEGAHYHFDCRFLFHLEEQVPLIIAQQELLGAEWRPADSMRAEPGLYTLIHKIQQLTAATTEYKS